MSKNSFSKYDSEFCGNVPIHLINVIQPYGLLLVVDAASLEVIQTSENTSELFGLFASQVVGKNIAELMGENLADQLVKKLETNIRGKLPLQWEKNGNRHVVLIHKKDPYYILEIELKPESDEMLFVSVYQELKYAMAAVNAAETLKAACDTAALELKKFSGFDKVMIYQFDDEWNGHVVSEAAEPDMESYIGFTFPASDIPKQARDLYLLNPYRYIPDRDYTPVRLYPVINPATNAFIDLSECNMRGVPSVHLEYLRNMRVASSMSTRILNNDQLWGLIACHHKTPRNMNFSMCAAFELLSGVISIKMNSLRNKEKHVNETRLYGIYNKIVEELFRSRNIPKSLFHHEANILELFSASGAILTHRKRTYTFGHVPPPEEVEDLLLWLNTRNLRGLFQTKKLSGFYDKAGGFQRHASGLLVLPLNTTEDEYLIVFRPETIQEINWGGNPEERMFFEKDMKTYHPRHSFSLWKENVSGIAIPWNNEELTLAENLRSIIFQYNAETRN